MLVATAELSTYKEDAPVYWMSASACDGNTSFGPRTACIIDEREGGIVAYCHAASAPAIVAALSVALT